MSICSREKINCLLAIPMPMVLISPSLLSADFANLARDIAIAEEAGADMLHIDVMDGHFVSNITIGPCVVAAIKKAATIPLDVHLMIAEPEKYVKQFAEAGSDYITVHAEVNGAAEALRKITECGKKSGISLNPDTPFSKAEVYLDSIDMLLLMTVFPGFAGQSFMEDVIPKIAEASHAIKERGRDIIINVDGGIGPATAGKAAGAGATMLVAGSAIFKGAGTLAENMASIKAAAE
jgi:ribulose-phosphate 3-epimerase